MQNEQTTSGDQQGPGSCETHSHDDGSLPSSYSSNQQLPQSEAHFRALADNIPQFVWSTDREGRATYFNRRFYEYTGLTIEESLGFGFATIFHPDDSERILEQWQRAWRDGEPYDLEYRLRRHDGVYRWFLGRGEPVVDPANGMILLWSGTCTDITDRREAAIRARISERILDSINDAFITLDSNYRIVYVNEAAAKINQKKAADFIGRTLWEEWPVSQQSEFGENFRKAMAGRETVRFTARYYDPGQYDVWLETTAYPASEDEGGGLHLVYRDISDTVKRRERELFLSDLAERTRSATEPEAVIDETVRSLGRFLIVSRCTFADIDIEADTCHVHPDYCADGIPSIAGQLKLSEFGDYLIANLKAGTVSMIENIGEEPDRLTTQTRSAYEATAIAAHITVPYVHSDRVVSTIAVHSATPRKWTGRGRFIASGG